MKPKESKVRSAEKYEQHQLNKIPGQIKILHLAKFRQLWPMDELYS